MKLKKFLFLGLGSIFLGACGGSDSDETQIEQISASIAEDSQWESSILFTDSPFVVSNATNGNVSVSAGGVSYQPNQDFNGTDSVTIEAGNIRYIITLTVTPVNDLPVLSQSQISVTANDSITGQLSATDVDGDEVSFSLASGPENGSVTVEANGEFTYTPSSFELPDASFEVTLSDGVASTTASVELIPSYATNEDKRAYYYRSDFSHLRQAANVLSQINDDIETEDAYIALAIGYANAGLQAQVEDVLASNLTTQEASANAFRRLANFEARRDNDQQAVEYYEQSLQVYAQFVADNGIENITRDQASFLLGLSRDTEDVDDAALQTLVSDQLALYLTQLGGRDREYTTQFGFIVTASRFQVEELLNNYRDNPSDDNKQRALIAADQYRDIIADTGYQLVSRGDNQGERLFRLSPFYHSQTIAYYYELGEFDKAKEQLARTIAFYTDVDYDNNFARQAQEYSAITQQEYPFPLAVTAFYFRLLYPAVDANIVTSLVLEEGRIKDNVLNAVEDANAFNVAIVDNNVTESLRLVEENYADDQRELVMRLTQTSLGTNDPFLGELLLILQDEAGAIAAYDRALEILSSEIYLSENTSSTLYATGTRGCLKFVDFYERVDQDEKANNAALICEKIKNDYFTAELATERNVVDAHVDAIDAYTLVDNDNKVQAITSDLAAYLNGDYSRSDIYKRLIQVAQIYVENDNVSLALDVITQLLSDLDTSEFATSEEEVEAYLEVLNGIGLLDYQDDSIIDRPAVAILLRSDFNDANFVDNLAQLNQLVDELSQRLYTATINLAVAEFSSQYEDVVESLASNRQYARITALIDELNLSGEEFIIANALLAEVQALQDDFPDSDVASVDTDGDGLANFYAPNVTEEDIDESNISLDEDADNDGTPDTEDLTPLGATS